MSVYSNLMWERNCTSLLRTPIELHLASPWLEGEQPLALIPWLISIFWVYHYSEGAKPSSEKRKHTACANIALLVQDWSWYCLLRGDFICNHIQAVNDLGPSEVVCMKKCFLNFQSSGKKNLPPTKGIALIYRRLENMAALRRVGWRGKCVRWLVGSRNLQLPQYLWGPLGGSMAWRLDYCPKFKEGERKHKRGGAKWQKRDNV